tara:strand:+ start:102 stop:455 length:354 start_codon:yes stop_codon:yes gene_type:complete
MNINVKLYTWIFGKFVGKDEFGNKYYCNSKNTKSPSTKRWVIYNNEVEASKVPSHWHAWLHRTVNEPPINYNHKYKWQKDHEPNMTGTSKAYFPKSHPLSKSYVYKKDKRDYEKWEP